MEAERARRVGLERVRELYGVRGTPVFAAAIVGAVIALQAAAWTLAYGPPGGALLWGLLAVSAECLMGLLIARFHARERRDAEIPLWGRLRVAAEAGRGFAWGLIALLGVSPQESLSLVPVIATLIGLVSAATAGLAVHPASHLAFLTSSLAPAALFLILRRDGTGELLAAGVMGTTFLLVTLNGLRMSAIYETAIRTRLELAEEVALRARLQHEAENGRRLAETAAAERTRFFGAASHDLRQPVHALGLYASLLRRDPPAKERRELIAGVGACVEALERLFNAILGVSQAAAIRDETRTVPTALQDVIARTLLQFAPEAERRGLRLRVRPTGAWACVDPTPLERVLANLVSNALRYTERGGVLVAVRRRGGAWVLVVADTGLGLDDVARERVFDAFYRVSRRQGDSERAFGLGLATVRQICLAQGWEVSVASRPGRGSLFCVGLPPAGPEARSPVVAEEPEGARAGVDPVRALIVEDDPLVADAVVKLLGSWDVQAHVCDGSEKAVEILRLHPAGTRWVGLLDYRLESHETGLDVADRLREQIGADFPMALITGELDPAVFQAARTRGLTVLQKPLRPIRLRALLASQASDPAR